MAWRLAFSLATLRNEVNLEYPNRSKVSDGTIGDSAHAASASDHNPNPAGVVCALDLTHDPANGFNAHALADQLITNRHPNLKYIISDYRIAGSFSGWNWAYYDGMNPHNKHIHISVGQGNDGASRQPYDDTNSWLIKGGSMTPATDKEIDEMSHQYFGYGASQAFIAEHRGKDMAKFEHFMFNHPVTKERNKQIAEWRRLAETGGGEGVVLKPGKYTVK